MSTDDRDWSGFALQLVGWEFDKDGTPTAWRVIAPGSGGSVEESQAYEGWLTRREQPGWTNDAAASIGWPLPHPETATALQRRPYDRTRFEPGIIIRDAREAAILAPGDFPNVDTSVEPPVFYPPTKPNPWPEEVAAESEPEPDAPAPVGDGVAHAIPVGWLCPRCEKVNAPSVLQCPCEA